MHFEITVIFIEVSNIEFIMFVIFLFLGFIMKMKHFKNFIVQKMPRDDLTPKLFPDTHFSGPARIFQSEQMALILNRVEARKTETKAPGQVVSLCLQNCDCSKCHQPCSPELTGLFGQRLP